MVVGLIGGILADLAVHAHPSPPEGVERHLRALERVPGTLNRRAVEAPPED